MKYEVIESKIWQHTSGRTASIYGACPWTGHEDRPNWTVVSKGWTVRNPNTGEVGVGRAPHATYEAALAFAESLGRPSTICMGD